MKHITLYFFLLLLPQLIDAQEIIENPAFRVRTGSTLTIQRIERGADKTRLYVNAVFRPKWWITVDSTTYLEDVATGRKFYPTAIEGMEFNKQTYLPESGTMDIVLTYPSLPASTTCINWIEDNSPEGKTYGISLLPSPSKKKENVEIYGNWLSQDGNNEWIVGLYDSLAIYREQFWTYETFKTKGKTAYVTLKNEAGVCSLKLKRQKDGSFLIDDGSRSVICRQTENKELKPMPAADDFSTFFQGDTAYIQGYLEGYDPILGFSTGMVYVDNSITHDSYPTVITIHSDGRFECKFPILHPIALALSLQNNWIPFYIEPGQTLTCYLNYEAMLEKSRARDFNYPLKGTAFMGKTAYICRMLNEIGGKYRIDYQTIQKAQKELIPEQFLQKVSPLLTGWLASVDSVAKADNYSLKATRLLRNIALSQYATGLLDYSMMRSFLASRDSTNEALKVKETEAYYDFLKQQPLDDVTMMACPGFSTFINRFEFMRLFNFAPWKNSDKDDLYNLFLSQDSTKHQTLVNLLQIEHTPFVLQLAFIRGLSFRLNAIENKELAARYLQSVKKYVTEPFLQKEGERIFNDLYSDVSGSYPLSEQAKGTKIFRKIADLYKGKYLLVDFWATTCGPCRSAIEHYADLRAKYRDNPDVKLIFITSETESPEAGYKEYVEKNLKEEDCFRLPESDYHYLRELFRFNGIPHYETVNREGRILRKGLSYNSFEKRLQELLEQEK